MLFGNGRDIPSDRWKVVTGQIYFDESLESLEAVRVETEGAEDIACGRDAFDEHVGQFFVLEILILIYFARTF